MILAFSGLTVWPAYTASLWNLNRNALPSDVNQPYERKEKKRDPIGVLSNSSAVSPFLLVRVLINWYTRKLPNFRHTKDSRNW